MRRTPQRQQPNEVVGRYLSQARQQKGVLRLREPLVLPSQQRPRFHISQLLNEIKRNSKHQKETAQRPATSRASRHYDSIKRNSVDRYGLQNRTQRQILLKQDRDELTAPLTDRQRKSMSNPNSRYKRPLANNEQSFENFNIKPDEDKMSVSRLYKTRKAIQGNQAQTLKINDLARKYERIVLNRTPVPSSRRSASNPPYFETAKPSSNSPVLKLFSSKESPTDLEFHQASITRYSFRTKKGIAINNNAKPNQDSYLVFPNIRGGKQHLFGVCDGHGSLGHHVSSFVRLTIASLLKAPRNPAYTIKQHLEQLYATVMDRLLKESGIDLTYSGTTSVSCYITDKQIYCANIGDSRAIIGTKKQQGWSCIAISIDHKPSVQEERQRIIDCGGRVQPYIDKDSTQLVNAEVPLGPSRVWLKDEQAPGLAMTRSLGDLAGASVGVSCIPQVTEHQLTPEDRFLLVATDGVWEFLSNDEIVQKIGWFYGRGQLQEACNWLLAAATESWRRECTSVDDITFVLVFFPERKID